MKSQTQKTKIILNLYNLHTVNQYLYSVGLGFYHTGIEINGVEYSFGGHDGSSTGVHEYTPQTSFPSGTFHKAIELGTTELSRKEIISMIDQLKSEFPGNSYDLVERNCNHFTDAASKKILGKGIPGYVNRFASMANRFKWLIPKDAMKGSEGQKTATTSAVKSSAPSSQSVFASKGGITIGGSGVNRLY